MGEEMKLPLDDWQFWVASAIALVAAYAVARMLLPASWFPAGKPKGRKVTLTVEGRPPDSGRGGVAAGQQPASKNATKAS